MSIRLITDLKRIATISERKERENIKFREYLKHYLEWSDRRLDRLVHEINLEVSSQIDCAKCRNCCVQMSPGVGPDEMERVAGKARDDCPGVRRALHGHHATW